MSCELLFYEIISSLCKINAPMYEWPPTYYQNPPWSRTHDTHVNVKHEIYDI